MSEKVQSAIVYLRLRLNDSWAMKCVSPLERLVSLYALSTRRYTPFPNKAFLIRISTYLGAKGLATWMRVHHLACEKPRNTRAWLLIGEIEAQVIVEKIKRNDEDWRLLASDLVERILGSSQYELLNSDGAYARHVIEVLLWRIPPSTRSNIVREFTEIVRSKRSAAEVHLVGTRESELDKDGIMMFGKRLTNAQLTDIHTYLQDKLATKGHYFEQEIDKSLKSIDAIRNSGAHYASYPRQTIIDCPHLLGMCSEPAILDVVGDHLGVTPVLSGINLFWTFATADAGNVSVFHRDMNGFNSISMYVFISDVDLESGPHQYVRGSANYENCRMLLSNKPKYCSEVDQFFSPPWASEWVPRVFGERVTTVSGPAGTTFLTDAYGLHRGVVPSKRDRLLFYAVFSLMPIESFGDGDSKRSSVQSLPLVGSSRHQPNSAEVSDRPR